MLGDTIKLAGFALIALALVADAAIRMSTQAALRRESPAVMTPADTPQDASVVDAHPAPAPVVSPPPPVQNAAAPSEPDSLFDEIHLGANAQGHYFTRAYINNVMVDVVVDTGATTVALRYEDAAAMGISLSPKDFTLSMATANGKARAAPVRLREVQIGSIKVYDVKATVAERGALSINLLGMTFLSRLSRVEMVGGALLLRR
jgi:aspartyl protease family protein